MSDSSLPAVLGERFRLGARFAEGGLSAAYLATDDETQLEVVVKVAHRMYGALPAVRERFAREAQLSEWPGPRVGAGLRGAGVVGDRPWIALERLAGTNLKDRIAVAKIEPGEGVEMAIELLDCLAQLHAESVVHRDVKPGNIMLVAPASIRVLDLGGALALGEAPPPGEAAFGTAAYGAPEQLAGARAHPSADLYASGVVLYELCCGRRPFAGDPVTLLEAHAQWTPPKPRAIAPRLSPELEHVLMTALEKDPARRYASAAKMLQALERVPEAHT